MSDLYLTPKALLLLAQYVVVIIFCYFLSIPNKSMLTRYLTKTVAIVVVVLTALLVVLLLPCPHPYLELAKLCFFISLCGTNHGLLQTLYIYPAPTSPLPNELTWITWISRALLGVTISVALIVLKWGSAAQITLFMQITASMAIRYSCSGLMLLARRRTY